MGEKKEFNTGCVVIYEDGEGFVQTNPNKPLVEMEPGDEAKTLKLAFTVVEDGESKDVITCKIRLSLAEGIQVELTPGVFRDGRQWLSVYVRNDSTNMSATLEPGGFPPELLVDNVPYRWSGRIAGAMPVCKPGQRVTGAEFKNEPLRHATAKMDWDGRCQRTRRRRAAGGAFDDALVRRPLKTA
jgi:hypothetical protein